MLNLLGSYRDKTEENKEALARFTELLADLPGIRPPQLTWGVLEVVITNLEHLAIRAINDHIGKLPYEHQPAVNIIRGLEDGQVITYGGLHVRVTKEAAPAAPAAPAAAPAVPNDDIPDGQVRAWFVGLGGGFYGQNLQTASIEESALLPMFRKLMTVARTADKLDTAISGEALERIIKDSPDVARDIILAKHNARNAINTLARLARGPAYPRHSSSFHSFGPTD